MLRIVVLLKPIPDPATARVSKSRLAVVESGPRIMNPLDSRALELALRIRDTGAGPVRALSLGRPEDVQILRRALAAGAEDAYLIIHPDPDRLDGLARAAYLAAGIERIGGFDLLWCGEGGADGLPGEVGPRLAERFGTSCYAGIGEVSVQPQGLQIRGAAGEHALSPPAVVIVAGGAELRTVPAIRIVKAAQREVPTWEAAGLVPSPPSENGVVYRRFFLAEAG